MRNVKQDGGIRYHVNIFHALVRVFMEIETKIYKVISKPGEKTMLVENFFKEEDIFMKLPSLQSYGMALSVAHTKILTYYVDVAKLNSGAPSMPNNEI